jgi:hypothetical protein
MYLSRYGCVVTSLGGSWDQFGVFEEDDLVEVEDSEGGQFGDEAKASKRLVTVVIFVEAVRY